MQSVSMAEMLRCTGHTPYSGINYLDGLRKVCRALHSSLVKDIGTRGH